MAELDLDLTEPEEEQPKEQRSGTFSKKHIEWGTHLPGKTGNSSFVEQDPNDFYNKNLQFLSGQRTGVDRETPKRPIFRLAFLLDSGPSSLAKRIYVPNSTDPAEIDNVPSDYYNVVQENNLDNLSVYFIDFTFEWMSNDESEDLLKPTWVNEFIINAFIKSQDTNTVRQKVTKSMLCFHLKPFGKTKNGNFYTSNNPIAADFWDKIISSYELTDEQKEKYSGIYTIWFDKKNFGFNVLEEVFKDSSFKEQVKYFKDTCLNKKIIDLFELSDLVSKNDMISKKGNLFLLFTKWLNYKNSSMSATYDVFNKKMLESQKTETISIDYFKRLDDFFFYSAKCFLNIIDQCIYENSINQVGSKGLLLEDFFIKDYALIGSNQDSTSNGEEFVDLEEEQEVKKPKRKSAAKKTTAKKSTKKKGKGK